MLLLIIEVSLFISLWIVFITQIVIPSIRGTRLFPFFRKSDITAQIDSADDILEELSEAELLAKKVDEINRRTANIKKD